MRQLFPLFYLLDHLSVLLPPLFCYWFLLENFKFHLLCCSSLFVCFSSSRSLLNVLVFSPFYFQDFGSSLLSLLWILFQVDCLFPLHLFGLVGFYLTPSSVVCFSVFSFCLTYLLCLGSLFRRLQVHSSHCFWCLPAAGRVGSVGCVGFLAEGTGACVLVDEAGSCLSGGQDCVHWCVLGYLWSYYDIRQPLC